MKYLPLCFLSAGIQSQVHLQQSGSELRSPGSSVKLSCKDFDSEVFPIAYMSWVRQKPGHGFEWIGDILPSIGRRIYGVKFEDKATLDADTVSNTAYLELNSLTSEDSAIYYCARHSVTAHIWSMSKSLKAGSYFGSDITTKNNQSSCSKPVVKC